MYIYINCIIYFTKAGQNKKTVLLYHTKQVILTQIIIHKRADGKLENKEESL